MSKAWPWEEQVFTLARTQEQHHWLERRLEDTLKLDRRPVHIYEGNLENVVRGRRESMVVFYMADIDVEGWLAYLNSKLLHRGEVIALKVR